jgi:hypothetical protein
MVKLALLATHLPALLTEVERLRDENTRWRAWWFEEGYRGSAPPEALLREEPS